MVRLLEVLRAKDRDPGVPAAAPDPEPPLTRVFSLRDDFPDAFHQLVSSPVNTEVTFGVDQRHFPFFLMRRPLKATRATLRAVGMRQPSECEHQSVKHRRGVCAVWRTAETKPHLTQP